MKSSPFEQLLDYRRTVSDMYARLRTTDLSLEERCRQFRKARDQLFRSHPQSALSDQQKRRFRGLYYYEYDPAWRFLLPVDTEVEPEVFDVHLEEDGLMRMQRFGKVHFEVRGERFSLSLFWILGYGGGVFLPFRDETNKTGETYGGGRYLLDTLKHADLGQEGEKLVIDFNYAYNPSCAYNPRWHCPLAPPENWLDTAVTAGERAYSV